MRPGQLAVELKEKARQLGFSLAGIALPQRPVHFDVYQQWLGAGRQAGMNYLADQRAVERRADSLLILPECRSILVLGVPYDNPQNCRREDEWMIRGRVAAYAWGDDYHLVLPQRLQTLVLFLEGMVGHTIPNRCYTDTGPVIEKDLAMRAGLGWIGKNSCLINPSFGSYFLLSEILLGIELPADSPHITDKCGSCTRCVQACPTGCILPDRTLESSRCISYQTIENKAEIPVDMRPLLGSWVFGCDICQMVCPWNIRFAALRGDASFSTRSESCSVGMSEELELTAQDFNRKYKDSALKRAKRRGYLRNVAIAAGNSANTEVLPALKIAETDDEPLVREAAAWAVSQLMQKNLGRITGNSGK